MKRALLASFLLLAGCGGGEAPAATTPPPAAVASPSPTAVALTEGDELACQRFSVARAEAGRMLDVLINPQNAALGPGGLSDVLFGNVADEMDAAGVSATRPGLADDMSAAGSALRQLRFAQGRPEARSVQAFDLVAKRATDVCREA